MGWLLVESAVTLIQEVGFPIAAAIGLGWFIYKLVIRIVDGMEAKLDTVDEKVENIVYKTSQNVVDVCTIIEKCSIDEISKHLIKEGKSKNFPDITKRQ